MNIIIFSILLFILLACLFINAVQCIDEKLFGHGNGIKNVKGKERDDDGSRNRNGMVLGKSRDYIIPMKFESELGLENEERDKEISNSEEEMVRAKKIVMTKKEVDNSNNNRHVSVESFNLRDNENSDNKQHSQHIRHGSSSIDDEELKFNEKEIVFGGRNMLKVAHIKDITKDGNNNNGGNNNDDNDGIIYYAFEDGSDPLANAMAIRDKGDKAPYVRKTPTQNDIVGGEKQEVIDINTLRKRQMLPKKKIVMKRVKFEKDENGKRTLDVTNIEADVQVYPYSSIGVLTYTDCQGAMRSCTASMVGSERTIITAAHCVAKDSKGRVCPKYWETATFYAGYIPPTYTTPAMWRGMSDLIKISYWTDTQKFPDVAVATMTNAIQNVGYLGAMKVFGDFFDPLLRPSNYICTQSDPNLCSYSAHNVLSSGYCADAIDVEYREYDDGDVPGQSLQVCRTTGMDYNCMFPRVITSCAGEWGSSGSPLIIDSCGTKPKSSSCMRIVAIYKGEWCKNYVATALGYAWRAITTHVDIQVPVTFAPSKVPTSFSTQSTLSPTVSLNACKCDLTKIKNGICDAYCHNPQCSFDGGDCSRYPTCLNNYCSTFRTPEDCDMKPLLEKQCLCRMTTKDKCSGV